MSARQPQDLARTIGFWPAAGVMIGVTIGSGIYRTPADIARNVESSWQIILAWVLGGLLSLFGALTYTELAVMHPRSGGLYNFLGSGLGPRISFIFGWTYMLITKPLAAAGIAVVFAEYLGALAGPGYEPWLRANLPGGAFLQALLGNSWHNTLLVCLTLTILTYINYLGMRLGSYVNLALTIIKIACLAVIVILAFTLTGRAHLPAVSTPAVLVLGPVLSSVLWTYDGWSDIGSIAGEVKDPQRNLPKIYFMGTLGLVLIYVIVNWAYLHVMSLEQMRGSTAVAGDVMTALLGPRGGAVVSAFVLISTLGATHASILTGARVTFAQAQDGLLFRFLGHIHPRHQTPDISLWTQLLMSCACALCFQQFNNLAGGFVFTMWIFYGLGGIAMMRLRRIAPDAPRPYRCWGYPLVPILFIASAAAMTFLQIYDSFRAPPTPDSIPPWAQTCIFLAVLAAGWPAYDLWQSLTRNRTSA